jgi:AraC-like DNA-binding protein
MATAPFFRHIHRVPTGISADVACEAWTVEAERCRMAVESALPDASVELYFNLGPRGRHVLGSISPCLLPHRAAWVLGARDRPLLIEKEIRDCNIVGIRLYPWMAECVLGVPASELRGSMVDLDALWGSEVDAIRNQLHETPDPAARIALVERAVATRARSGIRDESRVAAHLCQAAERDVHGTVSALAATHGLTHRRVIEIFDHAVGLKPKAYGRVRRLRRVLRLAHDAPRLPWTTIAHRCGYFDQSHLINDFRLLTGISPRDYVATRSSVGHGFVPHVLAR